LAQDATTTHKKQAIGLVKAWVLFIIWINVRMNLLNCNHEPNN
jgi:hypothetical protein